MNMVEELRGIFPIVYTPYDQQGNIDEEDLRKLCDHLIACGAHGLAGVGNASEAELMTSAERMWMTDIVVDQARGRVPAIIGTSAHDTQTAIELSRHAQKAGAKAVFLMPATTGPCDEDTIRRHFAAVAGAVDITVMIQDDRIPIAPKQMVDLSHEFDNIQYVKEERPDLTGHLITELLELSDGKLKVMSAGVHLMDELARGVVGAIPSSICVTDFSRAFNLYVQGDRAAARQAYHHCIPLLYARRQAPRIWVKEVLRRQGIFKVASVRQPSTQTMDDNDLLELTATMELMGPPY